MRELLTEIEIDANPERVWKILTDFVSYPAWNPFVRRIEGDLRVGARLRVQVRPSGSLPLSFRAIVLVAEQSRELRWYGSLWIPGLFLGEHSFCIETLERDRVRFTQNELFRGLLVPLLWSKLDREVRQGFEEMNQALKLRCESIRE